MSRRAFGAVTLILIITASLLLGGVSWYYMKHSKGNVSQVASEPTSTTAATTALPIPSVAAATTTISWQTYYSDIYGFEVQYPSNWEVFRDSDSVIRLADKASVAYATAYATELSAIAIEALPQNQGEGIKDIADFNYVDFAKECKIITFAGESAYDCNPGVSFAGERLIIFIHARVPFSIDDSVQNATSSRIVSSFKFTSGTEAEERAVIKALVENWKSIAPKIIPGYPSPKVGSYGYFDAIQFIGKDKILVSYQDDFNSWLALLNYDQSNAFSYIDRYMLESTQPSKWQGWVKSYGSPSASLDFYKFSSTRGGDTVYPSDWIEVSSGKNDFE